MTAAPSIQQAERLIQTHPADAVLILKKILHDTTKTHYKHFGIEQPKEPTLKNLLDNPQYKQTIGEAAHCDATYIRLLAQLAETAKPVTQKQAELALQNTINHQNLTITKIQRPPTEAETRRLYIDVELQNLGWTCGKDWVNEVKLQGMPNKAGEGFVDYVLYSDTKQPLAIIEAKKTTVDLSAGRKQAKLYADLIEKEYHQRPVIFLSNGYETRIINQPQNQPERKISGIYSKKDLETLHHHAKHRKPIENIQPDKTIIDRYYQIQAVNAVCRTFQTENRRKALLVMATGSGKTRVAAAIADILIKADWAKHILFLADRTNLVRQAKNKFETLLKGRASLTNLCREKDNANARIVFSTYQTMASEIDSARDNNGRIFTPGHFDLIIIDEAHRSIYNKYKDIFTYFDAPLLGLTATPKDDIDKNTYHIFDLPKGEPTFSYDLEQAVKDNYLVPFTAKETKLKFLEEGIVYDDLTDEDKEQYETLFTDEEGELPEKINPTALNNWVFNEDTIRIVLKTVMEEGIKTDYGAHIGKTIIFAKNHNHAEKILDIFKKEYPERGDDYCDVIDNYINYVEDLQNAFESGEKLPKIAISVDMLDTGIDIPEIVNLVFFKKVFSKAKFWQMIGRGTRKCPSLIDGRDKTEFLIFDFCSNFSFFRVKTNGRETPAVKTVQEQLFLLRAAIISRIKTSDYQTEEAHKLKQRLTQELSAAVNRLPRENFSVRQHIRAVDLLTNPDTFDTIDETELKTAAEEIAPLVMPDEEDTAALRFDALLYAIELASISGRPSKKHLRDLANKVKAVAAITTIPEITAKQTLIHKIIDTDYLEYADLFDYEEIRRELRGIMKYLPKSGGGLYETDFSDEIQETEQHGLSDSGESGYLSGSYEKRAETFLLQHQDNPVIQKLRTNVPLTDTDLAELEEILWNKVGTKEEYQKHIGDKPLGIFVREVVGMDMHAAKTAFSCYLSEVNLTPQQTYFVNAVVEYIVKYGMVADYSVFLKTPFTDFGSIADIFNPKEWKEIMDAINSFKENAHA